jgi:hypothetical protein
MTTIEDIERAISGLSAEELACLRAWFDEFEGNRFDERLARDARAGKLDKLAERALEDFRAGRAKEL